MKRKRKRKKEYVLLDNKWKLILSFVDSAKYVIIKKWYKLLSSIEWFEYKEDRDELCKLDYDKCEEIKNEDTY